MDLSKWALLAFAAVVVFGCAGGGGTGGTGGTGTTGTTGVTGTTGTTGGGRDSMTVNLPDTPGLIQTWFLTSQAGGGSRPKVIAKNPGDLSAELDVVRYLASDLFPAERSLATPMHIKLAEVNPNSREIDSTHPLNLPSKTYVELEMTFPALFQENQGGGFATIASDINAFLDDFEVTALRGRTTTVQLFLNEAMFDTNVSPVQFNNAAFYSLNRNPVTNKVPGFMSDYLSFDISNVANRPQIPPTEATPQSPNAGRVWFAGDSAAVSDRDARGVGGSNGVFAFLTPSAFIEGFFRPQDATTQVKSWELKVQDPQSLEPRLITALKGTYQNFNERLANFKNFNFLCIPGNGDGSKQQIVAWTGTSTITNMWFGTVNYTEGSSPVFRIYPIANLYPASVAGEIRGTFVRSSLKDGNNVSVGSGANWWQKVRFGTFRFDTTPGFTTQTGDFVVYRR